MNPFSKYPIYLKSIHVKDALQVCASSAREMMHRSGKVVRVGATGKSIRVPRDEFFKWVLEQEGKEWGEQAK